jgi:hypothetical protein
MCAVDLWDEDPAYRSPNGNDFLGESNAVVSIVVRSAACSMNLENGESIEVVFLGKDIDKTPQASSIRRSCSPEL